MKISTIVPIYNFENGDQKASVVYVYDLNLLSDFILLNLKNGASRVLVYYNGEFHACQKSDADEKGYTRTKVSEAEVGDPLVAEIVRVHDEANRSPKFPRGNSEGSGQ